MVLTGHLRMASFVCQCESRSIANVMDNCTGLRIIAHAALMRNASLEFSLLAISVHCVDGTSMQAAEKKHE